MKKTYILALAALTLLPFPMEADVVSESEALRAARNVLSSSSTKASGNGDFQLVWNGLDTGTGTAAEEAPFYVFNRRGGGFVVISAEDAIRPVLGYSHENTFSAEGMPENIDFLLDSYRHAVKQARSRHMTPSDEVREAWNRVINVTKASSGTPVREIESAKWAQDSPYNLLCPEIDGERALTGCAATAMAIVMRAHEWPDTAPNGSTSAYSYLCTDNYSLVKVPANNLSEHTYDWDNMPLADNGNWTEAQKNEVAQLMYDCGTSIEAQYGVSATSATHSAVVDALHTYMWFDQPVSCSRDNYSANGWVTLLESELDKGYPLFFSAVSSEGGHAFVLDGYDSNDYFRVNFGWGGVDNGYWVIDDLNGFSSSQNVITNLVHNTDYSTETEEYLLQPYSYASSNCYSMQTSVAYVTKGTSFTATTDVYNAGSTTIPGNIKVRFDHMDKNGNKKSAVSQEHTFSSLGFWPLLSGYLREVSAQCTVTEDIEDGDYLALAYQKNSNGDWTHAQGAAPFVFKYSLAPELEMEYTVSSKTVTFTGRTGMTYKIEASGTATASGSFAYPVQSVDVSAFSGKECTVTLDNGNETFSFELTLP